MRPKCRAAKAPVSTADNGGMATVNVKVNAFAPGVFTALYGNQLLAVATRPDGSYVSPSNPAQRGEIIQVYVTGLGQVSPATVTGSAGIEGEAVTAKLIVGLNNGGVPLISAVYAPGMVGVYIVSLQVPAGTKTGPAQPFGLIAVNEDKTLTFAPGTSIPIQ